MAKTQTGYLAIRAQNVRCGGNARVEDGQHQDTESIIKTIIEAECGPEVTKGSYKIRHDGSHHNRALIIFDGMVPERARSLSKSNEDEMWETEDGNMTMDVDCHFLGYTVLYTPQGEIQADIIALHGANGHPFGSWKSKMNKRGSGEQVRSVKTKMWLLDFLPEDIPKARIITYGYNFNFDNDNEADVHEFCSSLRNGMHQIRAQGEERPMIFICHSFGGLVAALAFNKYEEVRHCTKSFLFFGLPYRGFRSLDFKEIPGLMEQGRGNSMAVLEKGFIRSLDGFVDFIARDQRKIISFYETLRTPQIEWNAEASVMSESGPKVLRISLDDAGFGLPREIEKIISVVADHSTMVKFNTTSDRTYLDVINSLREHMEELEKTVRTLDELGKNKALTWAPTG